jgi:uncharacterized membrane protein
VCFFLALSVSAAVAKTEPAATHAVRYRIVNTNGSLPLNFQDFIIPASWQWVLWPIMASALVYATFRFPFRIVAAEPRLVHLILGSGIFLLILWNLGAGLMNHGFEIHLFGITAVVMLIGESPAILAAAFALAINTVIDTDQTWSAYAGNFVLGSLLPVVFSAAALGTVRRIPQRNLFIYLLGGGFFGAIAVRLLSTLTIYALFLGFGSTTSVLVIESHLPWLLLITFPEGFINGLLVSTITVYYPSWVRSFDAHRYLGK